MIDIDKIISELPVVDLEKRAKLLRALLDLLPKPDAIDSHHDFVQIDVPIESRKDEKTGALQIRFAYQVGVHNPQLAWRMMDVTQAAQKALLQVFLESIQEDRKADRIPAKSMMIQ